MNNVKEVIMNEKKTPKVSTIKSRLKKILKDQESYTADLDFMIELTAGNLYAFMLIIQDIENLKAVTLIEKTREGNDKKQVEPVLKALREQTETTRRCLRELKLTLATIEGVGDDDMDDLIDSVNSIE